MTTANQLPWSGNQFEKNEFCEMECYTASKEESDGGTQEWPW